MGWGCPCCSQRMYDGGKGRYCAACGYICYTGENYFERSEQDKKPYRFTIKDETGNVVASGIETFDRGRAEDDNGTASGAGSDSRIKT